MESASRAREEYEHTSMHTWCRPPAGFFCRKPAIGLFAPSGCSSCTHVTDVLNFERIHLMCSMQLCLPYYTLCWS